MRTIQQSSRTNSQHQSIVRSSLFQLPSCRGLPSCCTSSSWTVGTPDEKRRSERRLSHHPTAPWQKENKQVQKAAERPLLFREPPEDMHAPPLFFMPRAARHSLQCSTVVVVVVVVEVGRRRLGDSNASHRSKAAAARSVPSMIPAISRQRASTRRVRVRALDRHTEISKETEAGWTWYVVFLVER